MDRTLRTVLAVAVLLTLAPATGSAQLAPLVPVQGYLTTSGDAPVSAVGLPVHFRVWAHPTSTDAADLLFEETGAVVDVTNGWFTHHLGSTAPLTLSIFDGGARYLEVQVDGELPMTPRAELTATPYAAHAAVAASVPWSGITGMPPSIADGDDDTTYTGALPLQLTGTTFGLSNFDCDAGQGWIWTGSAWECQDAAGTAYEAGDGIAISGAEIAVDTAAIQARVVDACPPGQAIRAISSSGAVTCQAPPEGTSYVGGTGISVSGTTIAIDPIETQARVSATCPEGSSIRAISSTGAVTCEADDGQNLTAGTGLQIAAGVIAIDPDEAQARIVGTCAAGSSIRAVAADGTVTCQPDTNTDTTYSAGTGLVLGGGNVFAINTSVTQRRVTGSCSGTGGQDYVVGINADGSVVCGTDTDTNSGGTISGITTSGGLTGSGTSGSVAIGVNTGVIQTRVSGSCPGTGGQDYVVAINANGTVVCGTDTDTNSGGTITGITTSGGLTGSGTSGSVAIGVNTGVIQSRVAGTCPAGQAMRVVAANGTVTCQSIYDIPREMLMRQAHFLTGGGLITWDGTRLNWTDRIIAIGSVHADVNPSRYQNLNRPATDTTVVGMNGTANAAFNANGVNIGAWHALYYYMGPGASAGANHSNWRIINYTAMTGPDGLLGPEYILVAFRNGDANVPSGFTDGVTGQGGNMIFVNTQGGVSLRAGDAYRTDLGYQPRQFRQRVHNGTLMAPELISTERFHISLTYNFSGQGYASYRIPHDIILNLCGDVDGCMIHIGMENYSGTTPRAAAENFRFYYRPDNRMWRAEAPYATQGVDGNGSTQHVANAGGWDACYFTDGAYANSSNLGDGAVGMELLYWSGYGTGKTCHLTIID